MLGEPAAALGLAFGAEGGIEGGACGDEPALGEREIETGRPCGDKGLIRLPCEAESGLVLPRVGGYESGIETAGEGDGGSGINWRSGVGAAWM